MLWYQRFASQQYSPTIAYSPLSNRGSAGSYQAWANQVGDASYSFEQFLPYFEKGVQFHPPSTDRPANATVKYDPGTLKTTGGPLQVGYPSWVNGISSWIARALTALGVPEVAGFTSGQLLGWSYVAETLDPTTQTRSSSEASYLRQALEQTTNLQVYKSTLAEKILFDDSKQATAVQVSSGGFVYQIKANKEVIISAGAVCLSHCSRALTEIELPLSNCSFARRSY